jgi:hypothetical protein
VRKILTLRLGSDERELLEQAALEAGVSLGAYVRESALAAAHAGLEPFDNERAPDPVPVEEASVRPCFIAYSAEATTTTMVDMPCGSRASGSIAASTRRTGTRIRTSSRAESPRRTASDAA